MPIRITKKRVCQTPEPAALVPESQVPDSGMAAMQNDNDNCGQALLAFVDALARRAARSDHDASL